MQPSPGANPELPELVNNPIASLKPAPVELHVAGRWILVPAGTAADWLEFLLVAPEDMDLDAIFPGLADEESQDHVDKALASGLISIMDLEKLTLDLISEVSGRPWWVSLRMIHIAKMKWSIFSGNLILAQVYPDRMSLSAWLDALWINMFQSLSKDKWTLVTSILEMPPASEAPEDTMESMEMSVNQFTSLMSQ